MTGPGSTPIHVSDRTPRLLIADEAALRAAATDGLLTETHHLDLKASIPTGLRHNKELACDLASFAVDGGTLIVGVQEDKATDTFTPAAIELDGLAERVEQIAHSRIDPPLPVTTEKIPSGSDPTTGYLIIHVPASALAPHMVDGRYLGRGDTTTRTLSDAEVLRLHQRRRITEDDTLAALQHQIDRDPYDANRPRRQAHLFLRADPVAAPRDGLVPALNADDTSAWLRSVLQRAQDPALMRILRPVGLAAFAPSLDYARDEFRRAAGMALSSGLDERRHPLPGVSNPEKIIEVEIDEDGGVRVYLGQFSTNRNAADPDRQVLFAGAAVLFARQLIAMVLAVADKTGHRGTWALALGATGLRGLATGEHQNSMVEGTCYDEDDYRRATTASHTELTQTPGAVAARLVGSLLRTYEVFDRYTAALTDLQPPAPASN